MSSNFKLPGKIPVNPEQTAAALKLIEAKVTLHEQRLRTFRSHGQFWRAMWSNLCRSYEGVDELELSQQQWQRAHKAWEEAECQLMEVQIAELKSQAELHKALLKEADASERRLVDPGRLV